MDRAYIDKHLLVDRYLQGTLAEGEKADFEERLVWDQELIDEVELAELMREGLQRSIAEGDYSLADSSTGVAGRLYSLFQVPQYAAAASFLLAVTLTAGVFMSPLMPNDNQADTEVPGTDVIPLIAMRSDTVPNISVNDDAWTVLLVDVVGSHDSYRVTVRKDENNAEPFWVQGAMTPNYLDALAVGMPGKSLPGGRYIVSVEGERKAESGATVYDHIQELPFETAPAE